jgi:hypothetical protein
MGINKVSAALVAVCLCAALPLSSRQQPPAAAESAVAPLSVFLGEWNCAGKFAGSGKAIEAHLTFTSDLEGKWILFRHDDKPPFSYHALAEWGWDKDHSEFVMFVQDSAGGVRKFHSAGFQANQLVWDGDALRLPAKDDQRFTFQTIDAAHFHVSYFVLRDSAWKLVDSSSCAK